MADTSFNPLHQSSRRDTFWTTANTADGLPGTATALMWSFIGEAGKLEFRRVLYWSGVRKLSRVVVAPSVDDRLFAIFLGKLASNVDAWQEIADAIPGFSRDALERQMFGSVRPGGVSNLSTRGMRTWTAWSA